MFFFDRMHWTENCNGHSDLVAHCTRAVESCIRVQVRKGHVSSRHFGRNRSGAGLRQGFADMAVRFRMSLFRFVKWSVVAISFASVRRVREGAAAAKRLDSLTEGSLGVKEWRQG